VRVSDLPLSVLLARALGDLTAEFGVDGAGREGMPSVPMWFGLLRTIPARGAVARRELPELTRLSKRAVRQLVGAATRSEWVELASGTGVNATFELTSSGQEAATAWTALIGATEARWSKRVGVEPGALRTALAALVGQLDLELPHFPISYGSSDFSVTGGWFRSAEPGPPRIPAHGQDWAPVIRGDGDTVSALSLAPLLSQLLVAFTVDYTESGGAALIVAEGLFRGFGQEDAVLMSSLPAVLGVDGGGKSGLERHGVVSVRPATRDEQVNVAHLTTIGQRVRDDYPAIVRKVESDWASRYGSSALSTVRDSLERMLPALDPELPDALIATHVKS
jgi:hypothetical protein